MALTVKHSTLTAIPDDPAYDVGADEWNAAHTITGLGTGVQTFLETPSSANLLAAVTNETGTGALVFATSPALVTPTADTSIEINAAAAGGNYSIVDVSGVTNFSGWSWYQSYGEVQFTNDGTYYDGVYTRGANFGSGGRIDTAKASWHEQLECQYYVNGKRSFEYHQIVTDTAGVAHRVVTSAFAHDGTASASQYAIGAEQFSIRDYNSNEYFRFTSAAGSATLDFFGGGYFRFANNVPAGKQLNAAGNTYLSLGYINASNQYILSQPVVINAGTVGAGNHGLTANITGHGANSNLLYLEGSGTAVTGAVRSIFALGNASTDFMFRQRNTNASGRSILYLEPNGGDATVQYASANDTIVWNHGLDNSVTGDPWKLSASAALGTSDVITATTGGTVSFNGAMANGQALNVQSLTELTTIAAAATTDTTIQMPANSVVLAVSVRNTVAVTCTTNYTVGDAGSATRFSTAAVSKAVNSTDPGTKAGAYYNATAAAIRITPDTTPSDATGRVRVTIHYYTVTPPTS